MAKYITNYFGPRVGKARAPPEGPANLFPDNERRVREYVPYHDRTRPMLKICSTREGTLRRGCAHCTKNFLPIDKFRPPECNQNGQRRPDFDAALAAYAEAWDDGDYGAAKAARDAVVANANAQCPPCAEKAGNLSPAQKACKDCWDELRREACARQDGCLHSECVERGPQAAYVLQADHIDPATKVHNVSDYPWWSRNGGTAAMRAEAAKCQWLCGFCHTLEKTGDAANRRPDPATMPDGRQGKEATEEEIAQYKAKHHAKIIYPKQKYVDTRKLYIGACAHCARVPTPADVFAFDWDHIDPATKLRGGLAGKGGVGGLVHNHTTAACILRNPNFKNVLDAEMEKCQLLCHNCHHLKTHGYPPRV